MPHYVISHATKRYAGTGKDATVEPVFDFSSVGVHRLFTFSAAACRLTLLSPQSPGPTQAYQGSVGGEDPDLARRARNDAEVSKTRSPLGIMTALPRADPPLLAGNVFVCKR